MKIYNRRSDGAALPEPPGKWVVVPEGDPIPQIHVECREDFHTGECWWCGFRKCHSTMTPPEACVTGNVRAFAAPSDLISRQTKQEINKHEH